LPSVIVELRAGMVISWIIAGYETQQIGVIVSHPAPVECFRLH
jgi:hypothetical protein